MSALTIRAPHEHEREPLLAFVRAELGAPRTPREQAWQQALGPPRCLGAWRGAELVGAVLGRATAVRLGDRVRTFTLISDLCVARALRGGLARASPYVELLGAFFEHFGGSERDLVHFGTPVERSWRAGVGQLGYELLRPGLVLVRALPTVRGADEPGQTVRVVEHFDHQALWLDERCCGAWGASVVRDAAYLNARYADAPEAPYEALGCFDAEGVLRGLVVWRAARLGGEALALVLEWLVPDAEPEVAARLDAALARRAAARGLGHAVLLVPPWSKWFTCLQTAGWLVRPADIALAVRTFHPRHDASWLREHWWYGLGELDLA